MGKRTKAMVQKSRHRGPADGTHEDKYADKRERAEKKTRQAAEAKRFVSNDEKFRNRRRSLDAESEEALASLPGGTIEERLLSAELGLFQNQDTIQSALTPPKARS